MEPSGVEGRFQPPVHLIKRIQFQSISSRPNLRVVILKNINLERAGRAEANKSNGFHIFFLLLKAGGRLVGREGETVGERRRKSNGEIKGVGGE